MTLTDRQIELIETSFRQVRPIAGLAAELFYTRLFTIAPEVQPLFRSDMKQQGAKLMQVLGVVVGGLRRLDEVVPVAQDLAARHVVYGVTPAHYTPVGAALIHTLERSLDEGFSAEMREAWETAYALLSDVMVQSAYAPAPEAAPGASSVAAE